jgi:hypothetical protein
MHVLRAALANGNSLMMASKPTRPSKPFPALPTHIPTPGDTYYATPEYPGGASSGASDAPDQERHPAHTGGPEALPKGPADTSSMNAAAGRAQDDNAGEQRQRSHAASCMHSVQHAMQPALWCTQECGMHRGQLQEGSDLGT